MSDEYNFLILFGIFTIGNITFEAVIENMRSLYTKCCMDSRKTQMDMERG